MVPLLLAIPAYMYGLWGVGLVIVVGGGLIFIGSRLVLHKPVSGLDVTSLALGLLLAIAYFGFGNLFFLKHFGAVIYSALLVQVLYGELRGEPFTAQYSKQMYSQGHWATRVFVEGNRFLSRLWGVVFAVAIVLSAFGSTPLVLIVLPNGLVVLVLVLGPDIAHRYGIRFLAKGSG